ARTGRLEGRLVDDGHLPLVELDSTTRFAGVVALDEREGVLLPDGQDDGVAGDDDRARDGRRRLALVILGPGKLLELHADELARLLARAHDEALGRVVDDDLDLFFLGVLELPGRRLEVLARAAGHDLDVGRAQALRSAAAVHGGVADPDDE